jgi:VWFA-related protein
MDAQRSIQLARQASVPIYAISFIPAPVDLLSKEKRDALLLMAGYSRETGGRDYTVLKSEDLGAAMSQIQQDLRHQYVIGFEPPPRKGAAYRRIVLETTRRGLRVRCRTGYQQD